MATSVGQLAVGFGALAATYPITRWYDNTHGIGSRKRKFSEVSSSGPRSKKAKMAFARRRGRRSFRRKRFGRKRRFRSKKMFARRVKRVIYRTLEPKTIVGSEWTQVLTEAAGGSRQTYVVSPPMALVHGDQEDQFDGNQIWLKGMLLRGQVSMDTTTPTANGCWLRITAVFTKDQGSGYNATFVALGSTTTISTNPAQTAPNINPRLFDASTAPNMFVGAGNVIPFDRTNVTTLKSWNYFVNPGADTIAGEASIPTLIKCYLPINKRVQMEDPGQTGLTAAPRRFKNGTWYFVVQVLASATGVVTDDILQGHFRTQTFYKDI